MSYAPRSHHAERPNPDDLEQEPTGPVAADSLAAESIKEGGGFAENEHAAPLGVKGDNSNLANTDTSGATVLQPATSREAREDEDEKGLGSDEKGHSGLKYPDAIGQAEFSGRHNLQGYTGGPSSGGTSTSSGAAAGASDFGANTGSSTFDSSQIRSSGTSKPTAKVSGDTAAASGLSSSSGAGIRPYVESGPTYTGIVAGTIHQEGEDKPKGTNLTEGGDIPPHKTFTGDVGGVHDPGRLAEQNFEKIGMSSKGDGGGMGEQGSGGRQAAKEAGEGGQSEGLYDVLQTERAP